MGHLEVHQAQRCLCFNPSAYIERVQADLNLALFFFFGYYDLELGWNPRK